MQNMASAVPYREMCTVVMPVGIWWNIIHAYPYELLSTWLEHVLEEKTKE